MAPKASTRPLHVTADVDGKHVWYSIRLNGSDDDASTVKAARFSEMHRMDKALQSEAPEFPGRFPPKTCITSRRRRTTETFVESRRQELESYLCLVATHSSAKSSNAWRKFLGDNFDSVEDTIASMQKGESRSPSLRRSSSVKSINSLNRSFGCDNLQAMCDEEVSENLEESNGELGIIVTRPL